MRRPICRSILLLALSTAACACDESTPPAELPSDVAIEPSGDANPIDGVDAVDAVADAGSPDVSSIPPVDEPSGCQPDVALYGHQACATACDGAVRCWGEVCDGIDAGPDAACGLQLRHTRDVIARVLEDAPDAVGPRGVFAQVEVGGQAACGRTDVGELWCWGRDRDQVLAAGGTRPRSPARVGEAHTWIDVAVAAYDGDDSLGLVLAVSSAGTLWRWRSGDASRPIQVGDVRHWTDVETAHAHWCARTVDSKLWCGGANDRGQLGWGKPPASDGQPLELGPVPGRWRAVSLAKHGSCGLDRDGELFCWGEFASRGWERLAQTEPWLEPRPVAPTLRWRAIHLSDDDLCGIDGEGVARCLLADAEPWAPIPVPDHANGPEWVNLAQDDDALCLVAADGATWCRALDNSRGLAGEPATAWRPRPINVPDGSWEHVAPGYQSTCAVTQGTMTCWGRRHSGTEARFDYFESRSIPPDVEVAQLANGDGTRCIRTAAGALWCIGEPAAALGVPSHAWTLASEHTDWTTLALGADLLCGLRGDVLWCLDDEGAWQRMAWDRDWQDLGAAPPGSTPMAAALDTGGSLWLVSSGSPVTLEHVESPVGDPRLERVVGHCVLDDVGALYCPQLVAGGLRLELVDERPFVDVATTLRDGWCGVLASGHLECSADGPVAASGYPEGTEPQQGDDWLWIEAGHDHVCAGRQGLERVCWGHGEYGQVSPGWGAGLHRAVAAP